MKKFFGRLDGFLGGLLVGASAVGCVSAQTHRVEKTEVVVRAVGVYEWTGDMAKPTASRLIPVTLFIDGNLEDAGVYLARPVPFALLTGNVYELDQSGVAKGTLDLVYSRHLQTVDEAYDDGWFGYGAFKAAPPPKPAPALRRSKTLATLTSNSGDTSKATLSDKTSGSTAPADSDRPTMKRRTDDSASTAASSPAATTASTTSTASTSADDPDRPTMKRRNTDDAASTTAPAATSSSGNTASTASSTPADDPDRPTMKRRNTDDSASTTTPATTSSSGSTTTSTTSSTPADDPDRPTMKRRSDDSSSDSSTTASTGNVPANDPDRPTLKRRTPEEMKQARKDAGSSSVTGVGSLNDDPNRPKLHYGKPVGSMTSEDLPQLKGMPTVEVHQLIAVSDAKDREPHDFARAWEDPEEHAAVLGKMEAMARAQLAAYEAKATPAAPAAPAKKAPVSRTAVKKKPVAPPAPEALSDVQLKGYLLSYGGSPVYVYQAHTAGTGAALRYVTVVAQPDGAGELKPALQSVTDATHLDRTPLLRLVDAVDVQASNRASLLFEMRSQSSRQFALYRVIGARADQIFLTGTTQ
jgi:hypothetical protein